MIESAAAMTFSMMFGSNQNSNDDYSSDEDNDGNYYDDDEDDDDYADDNYDSYPKLSNAVRDASWEPQAKQYSNMNLKDQVAQVKADCDQSENVERKMKLAKKRADKRKKQKEKRSKESMNKESCADEVELKNNEFDFVDADTASPETLERLIVYHQNRLRGSLLKTIEEGSLEAFDDLVQCRFVVPLPARISSDVTALFKADMVSAHLYHRCIGDFSQYQATIEDPQSISELLRAVSARKIAIAERIFSVVTEPVIDFSSVDESGLSILHKSIVLYDVEFTRFVIKTIVANNGQRKITLNLNTRCPKKGWAPIHYAVEKANIPSMRLLAQAGANLQASSATDKRMVPLELAKTRIKTAQSNAAMKALAERVLTVLTELIAWQKKNSGKDSKKTEGDHHTSKENFNPDGSSASAAASVSVASSSKPASTGKMPAEEIVHPAPASATKADKKKQKKSEAAKKKEDAHVGSDAKTIAKAGTSGADNAVTGSSKTVQIGKSVLKPETIANTTTESVVSSAVTLESGAIISVASRDEMVDRLLSMGFQEADCLQAIQLYGTDFDRAISYLCEGPTVPISTERKSKVNSNPTLVKTPASSTSTHTTPVKHPSSSKKASSSAEVHVSHPPPEHVQPSRTTKGWSVNKLEEDKRTPKRKGVDAKEMVSGVMPPAPPAPSTAASKGNVSQSANNKDAASSFESIPIAPTLTWAKVSQHQESSKSSKPSPQMTGLTAHNTPQKSASPVTSAQASSFGANGALLPPVSLDIGSATQNVPHSFQGRPADSLYNNSNLAMNGQASNSGLNLNYGDMSINAGLMGIAMSSMSLNDSYESSLLEGLSGGLGNGGGFGLMTDERPPGISRPSSGLSLAGQNASQSLLGGMGGINALTSSSGDLDDFLSGGAIELSAGAKPFVPRTFAAAPGSSLSQVGNNLTSSSVFSFGASNSAFGSSSMETSLSMLGQGPSSGSLWSTPGAVGLGITSSSGLSTSGIGMSRSYPIRGIIVSTLCFVIDYRYIIRPA